MADAGPSDGAETAADHHGAEAHGATEGVEEVFRVAAEALDARQEWRTALEDGAGGLVVQSRDLELPSGATLSLYRAVSECSGVGASFATRELVSRTDAPSWNEFVQSETLLRELRPPDPDDPDLLGAMAVYENRAVYFGWRVDSRMLFASRRLRDGRAVSVKVPVDLVDGVWTTRDFAGS
eukprot:tig00000405_g487.t1